MKKLIVLALLVLTLLSLGACGREKEKVILHCDRCGKEVEFSADTNMTEDWIIVCAECLENEE